MDISVVFEKQHPMLPKNTFLGFTLFDANITSEQWSWLALCSKAILKDGEDHIMFSLSEHNLMEAVKEFNQSLSDLVI
jgi:hypothetical protein